MNLYGNFVEMLISCILKAYFKMHKDFVYMHRVQTTFVDGIECLSFSSTTTTTKFEI